MKKQFLAILMLLSVSLVPTQTSAVSFGTVAYKAAAGIVGIVCVIATKDGLEELTNIPSSIEYALCRMNNGLSPKLMRSIIIPYTTTLILTGVVARAGYLCFKEVFVSNSDNSNDSKENKDN